VTQDDDRLYGILGQEARADVDLVRDMFAAFARREVDAMLDYLAPDVTLDAPGTAGRAGRTEPYAGYEGIRQYFADVESVWDDLVVEPTDFRATPGVVIVFGRVSGRIEGTRLEATVVWSWTVRDGAVAAGRVFQQSIIEDSTAPPAPG
jgi:ketosteroid isomerase-like protein